MGYNIDIKYMIKFNTWLIDQYNCNLNNFLHCEKKDKIWTNTINILIKKSLIDDSTIYKIFDLMTKYNKISVPNFKEIFNCKNDYDIFYNELIQNLKSISEQD